MSDKLYTIQAEGVYKGTFIVTAIDRETAVDKLADGDYDDMLDMEVTDEVHAWTAEFIGEE